MADSRKSKLKKLRAPAVVDADEITSERDVWKGIALDAHTDKRNAWLREGLMAWFTRFCQELDYVQRQLRNPDSDLSRALDKDELCDFNDLLDDIWEVTTNDKGRRLQRVPNFLKVEPFNITKIHREKKG